ncbi:MAG: hypothetical protein FJZ56_04640, partial [Chlamydiae bacterium]|nr:hypothetical protein [Chlamydiota bacterium]
MQISSLFGAQAPVETRPSLADEGLIKYDQGKEVAYNWILGQVQNPQEREGKLEQFFNHGRLGVYKTGPKPAEFLAFLLNGIDQKTFEGAQAESINFCLNKLEKETFQKAYAKQHDRCPEFKLTAEQQRFLGISVEGSDAVDSEDSASTLEIPFAGTRRDQLPLDIIVPKIDIHQIRANRGGSGEQSEES